MNESHELYRMTGEEASFAAKDMAEEIKKHKKPFIKYYPKMKKEAFQVGFIKAAVDYGLEPLQAVNLLKKAMIPPIGPAIDVAAMIAGHEVSGAALGAMLGSGIGAHSYNKAMNF